jgi:sigma-B regulation protein RsbU (phosphoserine phosphatase)
MSSYYHHLRFRLLEAGLWPSGKLALITWYLFGLDLFLFAVERLVQLARPASGRSLEGWVSFLSFGVIVLGAVLGARWMKDRMLWRLRNRLIITYVFIGFIPVVLLLALSFGTLYLFSAQFAIFEVTSRLHSKLASLDAANSAIVHEVAANLKPGKTPQIGSLEGLRKSNKAWAGREVQVWLDEKLVVNSTPAGAPPSFPAYSSYAKVGFHEVVRDHNRLFLRAADTVSVRGDALTAVSSEPVDHKLLEELSEDLGQITLYASGFTLQTVEPARTDRAAPAAGAPAAAEKSAARSPRLERFYALDTSKALTPTTSVGAIPPPANALDHQVAFSTSIPVRDWASGNIADPIGIDVQTRLSKLYNHLFAAIGDFAPAIETSLIAALIVFAAIEIVALVISYWLTRTVTKAVAQLYEATKHINRADFSHRIPVRSNEQLSTLANSFNLMTASLEELIEEQKQKQRLENELVIAQEVQEQLYPQNNIQLPSLEVYGFCRPARTVSGDYYDFLSLGGNKLLLAVGDVSGKGISAALLMATIHSAARAYSFDRATVREEALATGGSSEAAVPAEARSSGAEVSPRVLLSLLNHQLYESTPMEKYATLFIGVYDGEKRRLTFSNGGHLPPIILGIDGAVRRLDCGGTVVGLFSDCQYEESSVQLRRGEIFLAYSDGVTEPENEFGEFGEQRLIDLVAENRSLTLERISAIVTAGVQDWIGAQEQPDDITLVLARAR